MTRLVVPQVDVGFVRVGRREISADWEEIEFRAPCGCEYTARRYHRWVAAGFSSGVLIECEQHDRRDDD